MYKLKYVGILDTEYVSFIIEKNDYDPEIRHVEISIDEVLEMINTQKEIIIPIEYEEYSMYDGENHWETYNVKVPIEKLSFVKELIDKIKNT